MSPILLKARFFLRQNRQLRASKRRCPQSGIRLQDDVRIFQGGGGAQGHPRGPHPGFCFDVTHAFLVNTENETACADGKCGQESKVCAL